MCSTQDGAVVAGCLLVLLAAVFWTSLILLWPFLGVAIFVVVGLILALRMVDHVAGKLRTWAGGRTHEPW